MHLWIHVQLVEEQASPNANSSCSSVPLPSGGLVGKQAPQLMPAHSTWATHTQKLQVSGHMCDTMELLTACTAAAQGSARQKAARTMRINTLHPFSLFAPSLSFLLSPLSGLSSLEKVSLHSPGCLGLAIFLPSWNGLIVLAGLHWDYVCPALIVILVILSIVMCGLGPFCGQHSS